jgi:bifunctional UDP-N-acetylglucosamine pyrophosphorylase/glucosamine-1-phosphate N-acetyltransferase
LGINSQWDLAFARKFMQDRILRQFMDKGIKIIDPANTYIEEGVKIGSQTTIFPFTYIENDVIIGSHCSLGPFIRVRKGTKVANEVYLGNFIEVNRSNIANSVTMKHFGYLGDTTVGEGTNIGAGTVVANYDGKKKHKTVIGKNAFIGSDTVLRAPVRVGEKAVTGCGSVVTKNVAAKTVVVGVPARKIKHGKKRKG